MKNEIVWQFMCNKALMDNFIKFFTLVSETKNIPVTILNFSVDNIKKDNSNQDAKYITEWMQFNKDMFDKNAKYIKGIKIGKCAKNCYNCLYFVGFGDKHKWDVFGRLIVNNITMDYAGILLAALKSVEKENLTLTVNANIVESEYNELFDKCF